MLMIRYAKKLNLTNQLMLTDHAGSGFADGLNTVYEKTGDTQLMNLMLLEVIAVIEEIRLHRVFPRKVTDYLKTWHCSF